MEGFIGEIRVFSGSRIPKDWMICNGKILNIGEYEALYTLIGATYGGDGRTTFALPNLSVRIPIGQGTGPNLSQRIVGQYAGSDGVVLDLSTIPQHNHPVNVVITDNTVSQPSSVTCLGTMNSPEATVFGFLPGDAQGTTDVEMDFRTITNTGYSQPHNNMMQVLVTNYIICVQNNLYPYFN